MCLMCKEERRSEAAGAGAFVKGPGTSSDATDGVQAADRSKMAEAPFSGDSVVGAGSDVLCDRAAEAPPGGGPYLFGPVGAAICGRRAEG